VVLRTLSQARAWWPAVVARLARTLGLAIITMRTARILLLPLFAWHTIVGAQSPRQADTRGACATDTELLIGGITLDDTRASVRKKLGNPRSVKPGASEDDGGQYSTLTYSYRRLEIVFGRSGIERVSTTSPQVAAARGITVGMTEPQVGERLGFAPEPGSGPYQIRLVSCRPPQIDELILIFAPVSPESGKPVQLVEVSITRYGP
jgi:hypothetical protein